MSKGKEKTAGKWPAEVRFFRHAESAYNVLKVKKAQDKEYQKFLESFEDNPDCAKTRQLAKKMQKKFALGRSDRGTPITVKGEIQAMDTGRNLPREWGVPDVIFVSPYDRALMTLLMVQGNYPELKEIKVVEEERVREQDHGLSLIYNDWRIFHALNPDQAKLFELLGEYDYRFPNGENRPDVRERTRSFLGTLIRDFAGKKVWVFTHHLTILSFRANLERWNAEKFMDSDKHDKPLNCGVTSYICNPTMGNNGKLILHGYNEVFY